MFLETERLILRKLREEDYGDFRAYAADEEMCRMMGRHVLETEEATARACFDWLKDKEERGYALILKETGRVIGDLTVTTVPEDLAEREPLAGKQGRSLNFSISRVYQRQGLMTEALRAVTTHLFAEEGMDYVQCGHFDFNAASAKLQKKLGFVHLTTVELDFEGFEEKIISVENVLWRSLL